MSMHKIKYRIVYNRKKVLNKKKGETLIQIEAYLDKKVYFPHIFIYLLNNGILKKELYKTILIKRN